MGAAYFYHLTQRPLVDTLTMLLTKSLENNWKVAVRGTDQAGLEALAGLKGEALTKAAQSFLDQHLAPGSPIRVMLSDLQMLDVVRIIEGDK